MSAKEYAQVAIRQIFQKCIDLHPSMIDTVLIDDIPLDLHHKQNQIYIYDWKYRNYLISSLHPRRKSISFDLFTKNEDGFHHPLFHAHTFKEISLNYFSQKININQIESRFMPNSVNYHQFHKIFTETSDKVKAAQSTWEAQSNALLGYSVIDIDNINIFIPSKQHKNIVPASVEIICRKKK